MGVRTPHILGQDTFDQLHLIDGSTVKSTAQVVESLHQHWLGIAFHCVVSTRTLALSRWSKSEFLRDNTG